MTMNRLQALKITADDKRIIDAADRFMVCVFLGVGKYAKAEAPDVVTAYREGWLLKEAHGVTARPIVYAVTADNKTCPLNDAAVKYLVNQQNAADAANGVPEMTKTETTTTEAKIEAPATTTEPKAAKPAKADKAAKPAAAKPAKKQPTKAERKAMDDKSASEALGINMAEGDLKPAELEKPEAKPAKSSAEMARPSTKVLEAEAREGKMPNAPDFSAPTHARFRKKLDEVIALVAAGDIAALKAYEINPISSSPKAIDRYRNLAVIALEAKAKA